MGIFARLSHRIGNNLVRSGIVKEEDAEIYIYGINQIFISVLNVSSALIIGWIFGVLFEIAVFMAAYIPLRSFAGGYHAKTPLRCYFFSVIMLIVVSICIKYLFVADLLYYAVLTTAVLVVTLFSPVEDKNKPLNKTEHKIYKSRVIFITVLEFAIYQVFKFAGLNNLFITVIYSFVVVSLMLITGMIKNALSKST